MNSITRLHSLRVSYPVRFLYTSIIARQTSTSAQKSSEISKDGESSQNSGIQPTEDSRSENDKKVKTVKSKSMAQADEELRQKLEQMSGGGGASGIEYEDGKPNTMKRSVRNNMFRYI